MIVQELGPCKLRQIENSELPVAKRGLFKARTPSHVYVFVNIRGTDRPEYLVVESGHVAERIDHEISPSGSEWFSFAKINRQSDGEGWELFTRERGVQ